MADEAITSLGFDASKAKQGAAEFDAAGNKIIAKNAEVEASEEKLATRVESTASRKRQARGLSAVDAGKRAAEEAAAASLLDGVIARSVDKQVEDIRKRDRALAAAARAYDPLGSALRKVEGDISRLNGIIEKGELTDAQAAQAKTSLAGAVRKLADAQRAYGESLSAGAGAGPGVSEAYTQSVAGILRIQERLNTALVGTSAAVKQAYAGSIAPIQASAAAVKTHYEATLASAKALRDEATLRITVSEAYAASTGLINTTSAATRKYYEASLAVARALQDEVSKKIAVSQAYTASIATVDTATLSVRRHYEASLAAARALTEEATLRISVSNAYNASIATVDTATLATKRHYDASLAVAKALSDEATQKITVSNAYTSSIGLIDAETAAVRRNYEASLVADKAQRDRASVSAAYRTSVAPFNGVAQTDAQVAAKAKEAAAATEAYQRQVSALKVAIDPLAEAQRKYAEALTFANKAAAAGDITDKQRLAAHALAATNLNRNIEALNSHAKATQASTSASRQLQFGLTNLSFQVNDVVSSLGAGISPAQTFFQQFGQVFQIGQQVGFKNLATSVLGLITPFRAALAGAVALGSGFTALLVHASNNAEQLRQFNLILQGTGKDSLTTAANLQKTVRELRDLGVGKADAGAAVSAIARNPGLNPAQTDRIAKAGLDVSARLGVKDVEGITTWTGAINGGVDALIKLGFQMDALSVPDATFARGMVRNGQTIEATNRLIDTITKNIDGAHKKSITDATGAVNSLEAAWRKFFDTLTDTGPLVEFNAFLKKSLEGWSEVFSGKSGLFDGLLGRNIMGLNSTIRNAVGLDNTPVATAAIPPATASASKAFSTTANASLVNVDPDLVATFEQALIESGMKAIITSSSGGSHAFGSQHYPRNTITGKGEALDYNLLDASGNPILHRDAHTPGTAAYDAYVKFGETFKKLAPGKARSGMDFSQIDPGHVDFGLLSGAPAGAVASSGAVVRTKEQTDALQKSYDDLSQSTADATRNAQYWGVQQQANTQQTQVFRQALAEGATQDEAKARAQLAYNSAITIGTIELQKSIGIENDRIAGLGKESDALHNAAAAGNSAAAGYRAAAASQAEIEVKQRGIGSVAERTEQILREGAAGAIRSSAQQAAAAVPQLVALDKLAAATLKGANSAREQALQNEAVLRTQDALEKAEAAGIPTLIAKAKAEQDLALAQATRADASRRSIAAAEAANDNRLTLARTQLETGLTSGGATSEEIQRQVAYLTIAQTLAKDYATASEASRKAYADTAIAIADANVELQKAQREQERWNDLVRGLANTIDNELTKSIENAFSEDKVESWGKRIQKWLGTATSSLSSSLFIKPALGTLAGALGFGTVAQGLGSFDSLLGTGTSGTSASASGGVNISKGADGSLNIQNLSSTASLGNSLFGSGWLDSLGSKLGFAHTPTAADFAAGSGPVNSVSGSLFGDTTLSSFAGGVGAGFGAGTLLNSLLGGNKTTGTIGSGVGSLAGAAIGSIIPGVGTVIGGLVGGAAGGGLGGLFGNSKPANAETGFSLDLATGKYSDYRSSGNKENDRDAKEIRSSISDFTKSIQSISGGTLSGYVNPQVGTRGTKIDYNIPGFGSGTYDAEDAQDAIDKAELAISRGLTGISATMKTVIDQIEDPADLDAGIKFAKTYEKIADAAKDAFSSIPSDLNVDGPFKKAKDDIKDTFDSIADDAAKFGLDMQPVTDALNEANRRLTADFNRYTQDLITAMDDPLQSLVDIEKRAGDARVKDAKAVAGDVEAVNKLNAKNLDKIWTDSTQTLKDLSEELKTGDLSGLTATQRLGSANDNYKSILADVQAGKTGKFDELVTAAKNVFSLSTDAYGQGPKTAGLRTDILGAIDGVLASRSFAAGGVTKPGWNQVGEQGPEWLYLPAPATVLPHGRVPASGGGTDSGETAALLRELLAEMRANTGTARQGHYETGQKLDQQTSELKQKPLYEPTRRKVA